MSESDTNTFELHDEGDRESFDAYVSAGRWRDAFWLLAEPETLRSAIKLRFLLRYKDRIDPVHYGHMLYAAYVQAYQGIQFLSVSDLLSLFDHDGLRYFGSIDASVVDHLPDPLVVYRGYHEEARRLRTSWTTDQYNASFFALLWHKEGGGEPRIVKGLVPKARVLVFVGKESEIIVDPADVEITDDYPVPPELWVKNGREEEFHAFYEGPTKDDRERIDRVER